MYNTEVDVSGIVNELTALQTTVRITQTGVATQLQGIYEQLQKIANKGIPTVSDPKE